MDLSAYVVAVDISVDAETIDIGTFSTPKATDTGKVTESITVAILWSAPMYTALAAHVDEVGDMVFKVDATDTKSIQAQVKYASLPWGRFEVGARVEDDLVLAVLSPITYAITPAVLTANDELAGNREPGRELQPAAA